MNEKSLVSIVTPCFNGEKFLDRYFNSILEQTYPNIELIFVNDGSTDNTERKALEYSELLAKKGVDFKYIYQENQGHSSVINLGLKMFNGKYLTWPDCDDYLYPLNIERKVECLEGDSNLGLVFTRGREIDDATGKCTRELGRDSSEDRTLFTDMLFDRNIFTYPVGTMVSRQAILDCIPDREIYTKFKGQNFQMLLPIIYKYNVGYVNEVLYDYYYRQDSESHKFTINYDAWVGRLNGLQETKITTVEKINPTEKEKIIDSLEYYYARKKFDLAFSYDRKNDLNYNFSLLKKHGKIDEKRKLYYVIENCGLFNYLYRMRLRCKSHGMFSQKK